MGIDLTQDDFFQTILQQMPGLVLLMDLDSKFVYSNKYTANMFGYQSAEEMKGIDATGMRCPAVESANEFMSQDNIVKESKKGLTLLDIHRYADGNTKILLTKKSLFRQNGEIAGVLCHCTEMSSEYFQKMSQALIETDNPYLGKKSHGRSYTFGVTDFDILTPREKDCMFYLLRGNVMKQIAKRLGINPRTVETYIQNIKHKLGCVNKSQLIDYGIAAGYLNYIPQTFLGQDISFSLEKITS